MAFASDRATALFSALGEEPVLAAAAQSRERYFARQLAFDWAEGRRICVFAGPNFAEGAPLANRDLTEVTVVCLDEQTRSTVVARHCGRIVAEVTTPSRFLGLAARRGETFDAIYLVAGCEVTSAEELVRLLAYGAACLRPRGELRVAIISPDAAGRNRIERKLGWQPFWRTPTSLADAAQQAGIVFKVWTDAENLVLACGQKSGKHEPTSRAPSPSRAP